MGDAAAQSRFDVSETAETNDNHVYIVLLGALDNCACDRAFPHFSHDIVNALIARPFLRIGNQLTGNHFQSIQVCIRDLFQFGICARLCWKLLYHVDLDYGENDYASVAAISDC